MAAQPQQPQAWAQAAAPPGAPPSGPPGAGGAFMGGPPPPQGGPPMGGPSLIPLHNPQTPNPNPTGPPLMGAPPQGYSPNPNSPPAAPPTAPPSGGYSAGPPTGPPSGGYPGGPPSVPAPGPPLGSPSGPPTGLPAGPPTGPPSGGYSTTAPPSAPPGPPTGPPSGGYQPPPPGQPPFGNSAPPTSGGYAGNPNPPTATGPPVGGPPVGCPPGGVAPVGNPTSPGMGGQPGAPTINANTGPPAGQGGYFAQPPASPPTGPPTAAPPGEFGNNNTNGGPVGQGQGSYHNQMRQQGLYQQQLQQQQQQQQVQQVQVQQPTVLEGTAIQLNRAHSGYAQGQIIGTENFPRPGAADFRGARTPQGFYPQHVTPVSPNVMRCTAGTMTHNPGLFQKWSLPVGIVLHPMAQGPEPVPTVNFAQMGLNVVIRCRNCRTYINPFVQFIENGHKWRCNVCRHVNVVEKEYYAPMEGLLRTDLRSRPELTHASCEFIAPQEYMIRPPQRPSFVFVLDVSVDAIQSGMPQIACQTIIQNLSKLPQERTQVAILTFDSNVHYYNLKSGLSQAKMMVMPEFTAPVGSTEPTDVPLPTLPEDLFCSIEESMSILTDLLEKIPEMFAKTTNPEVALGPAVCAAIKLLKPVGGKMVVFLGGMPSIGAGRLKNREDMKLYNTTSEGRLLVGVDEWYKETALLCSKSQIRVDMFCTPPRQYLDLATVSQLVKYTAGQMVYIPNFNPESEGSRLRHELKRLMEREIAFEAVMRVRVSSSMQISHYFGNFYVRGQDLMALPNIDPDKGFAVTLKPSTTGEGRQDQGDFCIQTALLFTSALGERRIRVHTLSLPTTNSLVEFMKGADMAATAHLMSQVAIDHALSRSLEVARRHIFDTVCKTLHLFKSMTTRPSNPIHTLMVPPNLNLLPLVALMISKHPCIRLDKDVIRADERVVHMMKVMNCSLDHSTPYFYPRVWSVLTLLHNPDMDPDEAIQEGASTRMFQPEGVYMVDTGLVFYMWVGPRVDPSALQSLFGTDDYDNIQMLDPNGDPAVLNFIRNQQEAKAGFAWPAVRLIKGSLAKLNEFMVEEANNFGPSYGEFLFSISKQVNSIG